MALDPLRITDKVDPLYRKMKVSQGGIMLLIRLQADLSEQPVSLIKEVVAPSPGDDLSNVLPQGSRLAITYRWLERQFGRQNANKAVGETATDLIRLF